MHISRLIIVFMFSFVIATSARADSLIFTGSTNDWHNPGNWDLGHVPGPGDDVVIDGGRNVVIDPALGPASIAFRDLFLSDGATLETLAGVEFTTRNETIDDATLIHRSGRAMDAAVGGTLNLTLPPLGCVYCNGVKLNPTPKNKRIVVLQSSMTFGLGGTLPASIAIPGAFGAGYYATLTTDDAPLGGSLDLETFYGFSPTIGQSFQIMNIGTSRVGEFDGLGEGAFVEGFGAVGMYISYAGGDGNDVVLSALAIPEPSFAALLGFVFLAGANRQRLRS